MHLVTARKNRWIIYVVGILIGTSGISLVSQSFAPGNLLTKDYFSDYLSGKAIIAGINPYRTVAELAREFDLVDIEGTFQHPNPHPPPFIVLASPLSLMPFRQAAFLALLLEISCLIISIVLLFRRFQFRTSIGFVVSWSLIGWAAVWEDLYLGQFNLLLTTLLIIGLITSERRRPYQSGMAIGAAISLKMIFWPLLIIFILCRRWKSLAAVALTIAAFNATAAAVLGIGTVFRFYQTTGPEVAAQYRGYFRNISLWSAGWRIFEGTGSETVAGLRLDPIMGWHEAAPFFSYGLVLLLVAATILLIRKVDFIAGYSMLVCLSLMISPLTWTHYLTVSIIPLYCLARIADRLRANRTRLILAAGAVLCLIAPGPGLRSLALRLHDSGELTTPLPFLIMSLIPMLGVCACYLMIYLSFRSDDGISGMNC